MSRFLALATACLLPFSASALQLRLPVKCEIGKTCFLMKLVDHDKKTGSVQDYRCGRLTDDNHKGTDIRLPTIKEMEAEPGVEVVAAASGTVQGVRKNMKDISVRKYDASVIKGVECGNGVRIEHKDGYATQYCHLKLGSITAKAGDKVKAGDVIGKIGMSGEAEVPHLHFQVSKGQEIIDPFNTLPMGSACSRTNVSLWKQDALKALEYQQTNVVASGFSTEEPTMEGIVDGKYQENPFPADGKIMYYWVYGHGLQPEQKIEMKLEGPHGKKLARTPVAIDKYNLVYLRYIGKKLKTESWDAGEYKGTFSVTEMDDGVPRTRAANETIVPVE